MRVYATIFALFEVCATIAAYSLDWSVFSRVLHPVLLVVWIVVLAHDVKSPSRP